MKTNVKITIFSLLTLFLVAGCQKATLDTYIDSAYEGSGFSKIAVFPIRNARLSPGESLEINRKLSMAINAMSSDIEIMSSAEAINILNEKELAEEWSNFLENYATSGIPNTKSVIKIGDALGVDGIIQGEITNIYQKDGSAFADNGVTRVTVKFSMFETKKGKLLWSATSDGIVKTVTTLEAAPPITKAISVALNKLLTSLPVMKNTVKTNTSSTTP